MNDLIFEDVVCAKWGEEAFSEAYGKSDGSEMDILHDPKFDQVHGLFCVRRNP